MNIRYDLPKQYTHTVTAENVTVGLLIEEDIENKDTYKENMIALTRHEHAYIELFTCNSGRLSINTDKGNYVLEAGDVGVIPSKIMHNSFCQTVPCEYIALEMIFMRRYIKDCFDLFKVLNDFYNRREVVLLRNHPEFYGTITGLTAEEKTESCISALRLILLLAEAAKNQNSSKTTKNIENNLQVNEMDRIARLEYIIESCFMNNLTARQAAEQLHISERQLARIVQKRYGITFRQAVQNKRLKVAAKMLTETKLSVANISQEVGFSSIYSFYRAFGNQYEMAPLEYRHAYQKNT